MAGANGFHFRTGQYDAGFKFFEQEIVMRSDPIDSSVALPGGGRVAAWTFLRVWSGLVCGLARHSQEKRYHIGIHTECFRRCEPGFSRKRDQIGARNASCLEKRETWSTERVLGAVPAAQGLRPKSVTTDETVTSELVRSDAIITLLPVYFWPTKATNSPQGRWSPPSSLHARND